MKIAKQYYGQVAVVDLSSSTFSSFTILVVLTPEQLREWRDVSLTPSVEILI